MNNFSVDLKQLSYLVALIEEGKFLMAAKKVNLSAAAFTRNIQSLENELGFQLIERTPHGAKLTPKGSLVYSLSQKLLNEAELFRYEVNKLRDIGGGTFIFGASPNPAFTWVPEMVAKLRGYLPDLMIRQVSRPGQKLLDLLHAKEVEIIFLDQRFTSGRPDIVIDQVCSMQLGVFCRSGHPLLLRKHISFDSLIEFGFCMIHLPDHFWSEICLALGYKSGPQPAIHVFVDDVYTLENVVAKSDLLTLSPIGAHILDEAKLVQLSIESQTELLYANTVAARLRSVELSFFGETALQIANSIAPAWVNDY